MRRKRNRLPIVPAGVAVAADARLPIAAGRIDLPRNVPRSKARRLQEPPFQKKAPLDRRELDGAKGVPPNPVDRRAGIANVPRHAIATTGKRTATTISNRWT
jgi:hypothetical protein